METNEIKYEVMNKVTGETFPVTGMTFGDGYVEVTVGESTISFNNELKDGNLQNPDFAIREIGTHLEADGVGIVEDVVVENTATETVAEETIQTTEQTA
jgi:hypothetical protein